MKTPIFSRQLERDIKRLKKRGYDFDKFKAVVNMLLLEEPLPARCRPHRLIGNFNGAMECHISPDWLLIYVEEESSVRFERTGTHSDLF